MGCTIQGKYSNRKYSLQIQKKLPPILQRIETLVSASKGSYSRLNSKESQSCLNFKIVTDPGKISSKSLNLSRTQLYLASFEYIPDFDFIKSKYIQCKSAIRHFYNTVHEVCIKDYVINDGIFIMLVSIAANENALVAYSRSWPFVKVSGRVNDGTSDILNAWGSMADIIQDMLRNDFAKIKKSAKRLGVFKEMIEYSTEHSNRLDTVKKAIKYCDIARETTENLVTEIEELNKNTVEFFENIKKVKKEIKKIGEQARISDCYSGIQIVHDILSA